MNSRDLNSINQAFVQATAKVAAEKAVESKGVITEDTIEEARPPIGAKAREGDPVRQKTKPWTGSSKTKNSGKKAKPPGRPKPDDEIGEVKEDLGPDFGDEADFGDPSRHSGDYLDDEPLDVGDIVEVEGEDDEFVIIDVDGDYLNLAAVGDAIEV